MNLFNQGMNGVKSLTGSAAAAGAEEEATSTKRKPTAYDNAVLNQTLASTYNFIQKYDNGGLNLFGSSTGNTSTANNTNTTTASSTESSNTSNPFLNKKKIEE